MEKSEEQIELNILKKYTYIYLTIPVIIFLFFWCKWIFSIPLITFLVIAYFMVYPLKTRESVKKYIKNNQGKLIIVVSAALIWVLLSGIGGYAFQNDDHLYRNAMFNELVNQDWPVIINEPTEYSSPIFIVYYFAFWLPAALIGKLINIQIGYSFLYIWSVIGVSFTLLYMIRLFKKNIYIPIIIFIFFSGLDAAEAFMRGYNILDVFSSANHIEYITGFQFSSITTQLFWVYNQALPAWLFTLLILNEDNNRLIGLEFACSLIFCTLPSVGLAFITLEKCFEKFNKKGFSKDREELIKWFKETFSFENIIIGIPLLIIFSTFVTSNISGGQIYAVDLKFNIVNILLTYAFEFVIYYILIFKYQKANPYFYVSIVILLMCPYISINNGRDFCMRASIPSLVILIMMILSSLEEAYKNKDTKFIKLLMIIFLIGSITPLNEFKRTFAYTNPYTEIQSYDLQDNEHKDNFWGYTDGSTFYKYFIKK